jgi:hypothetical protein
MCKWLTGSGDGRSSVSDDSPETGGPGAKRYQLLYRTGQYQSRQGIGEVILNAETACARCLEGIC